MCENVLALIAPWPLGSIHLTRLVRQASQTGQTNKNDINSNIATGNKNNLHILFKIMDSRLNPISLEECGFMWVGGWFENGD